MQHKGNNAVVSLRDRSTWIGQTMKLQNRLLVFAAIAAFATAGAAVAQDLPPQPAHPGGMMHEHMKAQMEAHRLAHIKAMHDLLQIRPDQEAAWQAFTASMTPPPHPDGKDPMAEHKAMAAMTTPERLDAMAAEMSQHVAEHQAQFQRHAEAVKHFYAVLSPAQQKAFDALALSTHHGMGHHEMDDQGMGGWRHPPMGGPDAPPPPPHP
jgi:hypothetical protein